METSFGGFQNLNMLLQNLEIGLEMGFWEIEGAFGVLEGFGDVKGKLAFGVVRYFLPLTSHFSFCSFQNPQTKYSPALARRSKTHVPCLLL